MKGYVLSDMETFIVSGDHHYCKMLHDGRGYSSVHLFCKSCDVATHSAEDRAAHEAAHELAKGEALLAIQRGATPCPGADGDPSEDADVREGDVGGVHAEDQSWCLAPNPPEAPLLPQPWFEPKPPVGGGAFKARCSRCDGVIVHSICPKCRRFADEEDDEYNAARRREHEERMAS